MFIFDVELVTEWSWMAIRKAVRRGGFRVLVHQGEVHTVIMFCDEGLVPSGYALQIVVRHTNLHAGR